MIGSMDDAGAFQPYLWNLYQCRYPLELTDGRLEKLSLVVSVTPLDPRVAEDRKQIGNCKFNEFDYSAGVGVVV